MIEDEYGTSITDENTLDYLLHMEFTLIEENQDMDIQSIEKLDMCKFGHNNTISQQEAWFIEKVNELIQAIKQLDRQINNN